VRELPSSLSASRLLIGDVVCARCQGSRWFCEAHPDRPSPHDDCPGPGEPCPLCNTNDPPQMSPGFRSIVELRGIGNLWLNGTLIRNGVHYLVRFEQRGIMGHISGSIDVDPCGNGAALISMNDLRAEQRSRCCGPDSADVTPGCRDQL
jgi:hypothetical protein